jgi:hypothetical protein
MKLSSSILLPRLITGIAVSVAACSVSAEALTLEELNQKVIAQDQKIRELEANQVATADAIEQQGSFSSGLAEWASKTTVGGYGEHHFTNNQGGGEDDQIDAHRFVVFLSHQFNDTLRFFSEIEIEHGFIADNGCKFDDGNGNGVVDVGESIDCDNTTSGEVELEQAYIEWDFAKHHSLQIGQFLLPVGILNETHEPDTFYGTERNNVEKHIIPSTWWETGVMVSGEIAAGLSYNAAVHSGLNVDTADFVIRDGRQKSAKATANDFAFTGRLKYTGIQGLELAASAQYQEDITQGNAPGDTHSAVLLESHAIIQAGSFALRALYAQWDIQGDAVDAVNADSQEGFYVEPSFKVTEKLGVFARYSEWERGDKIDQDYDSTDVGLNYWLHPNVVLKADYSDVSDDAGSDTLNLGVGWSF